MVIPFEVQEITALGPKFRSIPKPTKHNIIETVKNVEHTLKKSELPHETQQTIRHKIVNHI